MDRKKKYLILIIFCFFISQLKAMEKNWKDFFSSEWSEKSSIILDVDVEAAWSYMDKNKNDISKKVLKEFYEDLKTKHEQIENKKAAEAFKLCTDPIIAKLKNVFKDGRQITKVEDFVKLFEITKQELSPENKEKIIKLAWEEFIGIKGAVEIDKDTYIHPHIVATNLGLHKFLKKGKQQELNNEFNKIIGNSTSKVSDIVTELLSIFKDKAWAEFDPELLNKVIYMAKKNGLPNFDELISYLGTVKFSISIIMGETKGKEGDIPMSIDAKIDAHIINDKSKHYGNWFCEFKDYILKKINENNIKKLKNEKQQRLKQLLSSLNIWNDFPKKTRDAFEEVKLPHAVSEAVTQLAQSLKDNQITETGTAFSKITFDNIEAFLATITPYVDRLSSADIARLKKFCERPKVKSHEYHNVDVERFVKSLDEKLARCAKIETGQMAAEEQEKQAADEKERQRKELKKQEKAKQEKAKLDDFKIKLLALRNNLQILKNKLDMLNGKLKVLKDKLR